MKVLYFDMKKKHVLPPSLKDVCILIDNAQCLGNDSLSAHLKSGRSFCLCFSPVLVTDHATFAYNCGIHYSEQVHFKPFSDKELKSFIQKRENMNAKTIDTAVVQEAKSKQVLLPRLLEQCRTSQAVREWINTELMMFLCKFSARMSTDVILWKQLTNILMSSAPGFPIQECDVPVAISSGLFNKYSNMETKPVYSRSHMLPYVHSHVCYHYEIMIRYDLGSTVEFLFTA